MQEFPAIFKSYKTVGSWISLTLIGILGVDGIIGFTYNFVFAFLLPILFPISIL